MFFEDAAAIAQPVAAVGVEGDDGFPAEVVGRQERAHKGGVVSPQTPAFDGQAARQWYRLGAGPLGKQ